MIDYDRIVWVKRLSSTDYVMKDRGSGMPGQTRRTSTPARTSGAIV